MSDHAEFLAEGFDQLLDTQGQLVLWQFPDDPGSAGACIAIVGPESVEERPDDRGRRKRRVRSVSVRTADVVLPTLRINFTINMEVWQVEAIEQTSSVLTRFRCVMVGRISQTREGMEKE